MGNYIRVIREDRKLTTEKLAKMVHTSQQQISLLEKKRNLRWEWIVRLANALECHPMEITEGPLGAQAPIERTLLEKFRGMSEADQARYLHMADVFLSSTHKEKKS